MLSQDVLLSSCPWYDNPKCTFSMEEFIHFWRTFGKKSWSVTQELRLNAPYPQAWHASMQARRRLYWRNKMNNIGNIVYECLVPFTLHRNSKKIGKQWRCPWSFSSCLWIRHTIHNGDVPTKKHRHILIRAPEQLQNLLFQWQLLEQPWLENLL